jgi:hypothetical protein
MSQRSLRCLQALRPPERLTLHEFVRASRAGLHPQLPRDIHSLCCDQEFLDASRS